YTTLFRSIRAVAYAAKGETAKAREEQKLFREAAKKPAKDATFGNNKAADLFAVGDDMLEGEILVREGKMEAGIKALRAAVAKEDKLRYSEPPRGAAISLSVYNGRSLPPRPQPASEPGPGCGAGSCPSTSRPAPRNA